MHDKDHSREHTRAAAKTGDGPETEKLDAQSVVQREADAVARQQGGAGNGVDFGSVTDKVDGAKDVRADRVQEDNDDYPPCCTADDSHFYGWN